LYQPQHILDFLVVCKQLNKNTYLSDDFYKPPPVLDFYLIYLVSAYTLLGNPEHFVIYKNHGIYMCYVVGAYTLSGYPEHFVIDANHSIYIFYIVGDFYKPHPVLDVLIVCKLLQDKTDKYHDLYQSQHVLDILMEYKHLQHNNML
jgi:hypothetical protein